LQHRAARHERAACFNYFDFSNARRGERPLLALIEHLQNIRPLDQLVRTYTRERHYVDHKEPDIAFSESGTPTYAGLPLDDYLSLLDMPTPCTDSVGRPLEQLTIAHGCYWKKCSFCDVNLDYISRYDLASTDVLIGRIESLIRETDKLDFTSSTSRAAQALKSLATALLQRKLDISWWATFVSRSHSMPVFANYCAERLHRRHRRIESGIRSPAQTHEEGVSVAQVARVTRGFSDAGILVHAYLMYGFPTQTVQDTVDALEYVRQLFAAGCIQSGFFHRFTCTCIHRSANIQNSTA